MNRTEAIELLEFYALAGVDILIDEEPHNRFEEIQNSPEMAEKKPVAIPVVYERPLSHPATDSPEVQSIPVPTSTEPLKLDEDPVALAQEAVLAANTLDALVDILRNFNGCILKQTAKNLVFEDGNRAAKLMIIGDTPGRDEDISGQPFAGRSGLLLDKILASIGLNREQVYLANIIPWRPPGNRAPTAIEVETCLPFILKQIELAGPNYLILLGNAARTLLKSKEGVLKLRGKWHTFSSGTDDARRDLKLMATLHPTQLLTHSMQKKLAWQDMLMLKKQLSEDGFYE